LEVQTPKSLVPKFFGKTASTYDKIAIWTTFGKDRYWKKEILNQVHSGSSFLDLACGTGILTRAIAEKFPDAKVVGVDITQSYLDVAKENSKNYKNISYILQDAEQLSLDGKFDCITSSYIPKYCDAEVLVKVCMAHLNPNGKIVLHDFTYPGNPVVQKLWDLYFVILNFVGLFISSWKEAFEELPSLIRSSNWLDDFKKVMKENGLKVEERCLTWHSSAIVVGTKQQFSQEN